MNEIIEIVKITLPIIVVVYGFFLVIRSFLNKKLEEVKLQSKSESSNTTLKLRLQAYERMVLFLERITPDNLFLRLKNADLTAEELRIISIEEIRTEYAHNFSQQIYLSQEAWVMIQQAKENVIQLINQSKEEVQKDAPSSELSKRVLHEILSTQDNQTSMAMNFLKKEIQTLFFE